MHLGAFSLDTFYAECTAMCDDDAVTDAQPQARAVPSGFGRKERIHYLMEYSGRDSYPVIMKRHLYVRTPIYGDLFSQNFQDFSRVSTWVFQVERVARIVNDVKKYLLNFLIIGHNLRQSSCHTHVQNNAIFF